MKFGKKKQALFNAMDDSRVIVNDFCLRSSILGFVSYRTAEYRPYHKLSEEVMLPMLDEHLAKLLSGEIDEGNADMLDGLIFGMAREAQSDLNRQHFDHGDMLRQLDIRRLADMASIHRIRAQRAEELKDLQTEYGKICRALEKEEVAL